MKPITRLIGFGGILAAGLWFSSPARAAGDEAGLAETLEKVAAYKLGDSRKPLVFVEGAVRTALSDPAARRDLASRLAALLEAESTTLDGKRFVCRQLALAGGAEVVPVLKRLLPEKTLSHIARFALERIPDGAAGQALRHAVQSLSGALRIGVINSVGERRDAGAVPVLAEAFGSNDLEVATAAAEALGKIGGPAAIEALESAPDRRNLKLRLAVGEACLRGADGLVRDGNVDRALRIYRRLYVPGSPLSICKAAFVGLVTHHGDGFERSVEALRSGHPEIAGLAARLLRERFPGASTTRTLIDLAPRLGAARRALLLGVLGARGEPAARPVALEATRSGDARLELAGVEALRTLGRGADVPALAAVAAKHSDKSALGIAARQSLHLLADPAADRAILASARAAGPSLRVVLLEAVLARRIADSGSLLYDAARNADRKVRKAAFAALGTLTAESDLPALVTLVAQAPEKDLKDARRALAAACRRIDDREARAQPVLEALAGVTPSARCALLPVLARVGGRRALAQVRADLKSPDADVCDAAVRAVSDWMDASPLDDVLAIARQNERETHQVLALRGYARMLGLKSPRPAAKTVALYRDGLTAARRPSEKKLMISGLGKLEHVLAMRAVRPCLEESELAEEARTAIVRLAERIAGADEPAAKAEALEILDAAIPGIESDKLEKRARKAAGRLRRAVRKEL